MLAILDIGEVDFVFKATNPTNSIESALSRTQQMDVPSTSSKDISDIANITPIIEDKNSKKVLGSSQEIVIYSCTKDRRNHPKLNAKGKPIKPKKGAPVAKSLYPVEAQFEIDRVLGWFLSKFRPYT